MDDSLSKSFHHAFTYYLRALYLGALAAFIVAFLDLIAPSGWITPISIIILILTYTFICFSFGYSTGKRGYFISLTTTLPLAVIFYWTPDSLADVTRNNKDFMLISPILFFILTSIGQGLGQRARKLKSQH